LGNLFSKLGVVIQVEDIIVVFVSHVIIEKLLLKELELKIKQNI
jgi:hypothetical protein